MNIGLSSLFLLLSYFGTQIFVFIAQNSRLVDKPNDRTLHLKPTVRGGGLVFISLALISVPLLCHLTQTSLSAWTFLWLSWFLLALISFWDDLSNLSIKFRLLIQCLVAAFIAYSWKPQSLDFIWFSLSNPYWIAFFVFFMVLWAINHFNFMDGLDGFCAFQALFLLLAYFLLFSLAQAVLYQKFCLILLCALCGFLKYNLPPAKLFMGDVGSASLGLIIFSLALIAQKNYQIPILYWFILNGLFLFDASLTLIRRIWNQERWFAPHKKHAYQRLRQSGMKTYSILLGQILINACIGFLMYGYLAQCFSLSVLLCLQSLLLVTVFLVVEQIYPMKET